MILHTLNVRPDSSAYKDCLAVCRKPDALLFLGDGVYALLAASAALQQLESQGVELYALTSDLKAAGVNCAGTPVHAIDMDGFVQLSERYPRQMAWY